MGFMRNQVTQVRGPMGLKAFDSVRFCRALQHRSDCGRRSLERQLDSLRRTALELFQTAQKIRCRLLQPHQAYVVDVAKVAFHRFAFGWFGAPMFWRDGVNHVGVEPRGDIPSFDDWIHGQGEDRTHFCQCIQASSPRDFWCNLPTMERSTRLPQYRLGMRIWLAVLILGLSLIGYAQSTDKPLPRRGALGVQLAPATADELKSAGIEPQQVITDASALYPAVLAQVWP